MNILFLIGRIIVGLFYIMMGINHFTKVNDMAGYAASKNVPAPKLAVLGSGVLLLVGGLTIITGFQPIIGIIAIVLFFIPVTIQMHPFWQASDPQAQMMEMTQFMKNMALMGSTLMFLAINQPWPLGIG